MVNINLSDPSVQRLMGTGEESQVASPNGPRRMTQIAGDMDSGLSSTTRLDVGKHEVACFVGWNAEGIAVVDVYAIPGEPVKVHFICPRCHHRLTISGDKKKIDWNPAAENPVGKKFGTICPAGDQYVAAAGGELSVETFACTWELEDAPHEQKKNTGVIVKGSLCRWRGMIDRNLIREA